MFQKSLGPAFAVFVLALVAPGNAWPAGPGPATHALAIERGSRLSVAAKINGKPVNALLDSAAELTLIDSKWARTLKLGQGKSATGQGSGEASFEAQLVEGVTLEALGLQLAGQTVAVACCTAAST
jgi:hypothetical protein